jgi:hypothetical protein
MRRILWFFEDAKALDFLRCSGQGSKFLTLSSRSFREVVMQVVTGRSFQKKVQHASVLGQSSSAEDWQSQSGGDD